MCVACYEKYGSPKIDNPKVRRATQLADQCYEYTEVGGNLHVALDDWNLETFEFCKEQVLTKPYFHDDPDTNYDGKMKEVELECCEAFLDLSLDERASALALHRGYWGVTKRKEYL